MMLRALLTIGAVQVITMLVLLVRTKTLAVAFGPETVGVMAVIDKLLAVIAQTVSLSLPFAAARFLPEQWTAGPAAYRDLFTRMRNVLLALVLAAMAASIALTLARPAAWGEALTPYRDIVIVAMLGLPVVGLMPFLQNAIAGRMQQNRAMLAGLAHAVVLAVAVAGIVWNGLIGFYAAYAVLGGILMVVVTRTALLGTRVPENAEPEAHSAWVFKLPTPIWRFAGALLVLAFLGPYSALLVHYQVLSIHGAQAAGWMQAAIGISLAVRAVLGSAHAVFLTPNVNRGGEPAERMAWANGFQATLCLLAGISLPLLLLFPEIAVHVLYSADFGPGAAFVAVFVASEVLGLLSGTYQSLIVAFNHLRFHVASNLLAQLLVAGIALALVEPLGILGAGLALLAAPVFLFSATMTFLHRSYKLRMTRPVVARSAWLGASLVACGILGATAHDATWPTIALKIGMYGVAAVGFARLLNDEERQKVRAFLERFPARWK